MKSNDKDETDEGDDCGEDKYDFEEAICVDFEEAIGVVIDGTKCDVDDGASKIT